MRVTVLGTGIMGAPMARNIAAAGHDVRAWNRTIEKAQAIEGVEAVDDPAEAVRGAEVVVTLVSDGDAVCAILDRTLDAFGEDAVLCQMSTIGIRALDEVAQACERARVELVDAPVSGTRQPAEQGELVVLASGPQHALDRCGPVFDAVGANTVRLGGAGEGTRLKLVLNHWLLGVLDTLAETIALAGDLQIDPRLFLDTIRGGPLGLPYADLKGKAMIDGAYSPPAFPLHLARKDADLVVEATDLELIRHVRAHLATAERAGHGDEDMAAIAAVPTP